MMLTPNAASPSRLLRRFEQLSRRTNAAVEDRTGRMSFQELHVQSEQLAHSLTTADARGDRIGLLAAAGGEWVVAFWAILRSGNAVVPLTPLYPPEQNAELLRRAGVTRVLADPAQVAALRDLGFEVLELSAMERSTGGDDATRGASATSAPNAPAASGQASTPPPWPAEVAPDAETREALLLFTSGTTGQPKLVPHSHQTVFDGVVVLAEAWGARCDDVLVHMLPLHHLHGICVALLQSLLSGGTTRFVGRFEPRAALEACAGASVVMGVPTQYQLLMSYIDDAPADQRRRFQTYLSRLRLLTSGSAKLPETLGERLRAVTGQFPLERYGMTEVGIVLSNPLSGERRPGSCGRPLPGVRARIVDERGVDVADGASGELWIAAPSVFSGYDGDARATAESFVGDYFRTGDTAVWLEGGFIRVLGRTSVDIIKSGGEKLSALEMEELLRSHESVDDVAVVGLPDELWGEAATAAVLVRDGAVLEFPAQLRAWCKERTAPFKVPRNVVVVSELPRNALGKVNKRELIARLLAR